MSFHRRSAVAVGAFFFVPALFLACGARTGLIVPPPPETDATIEPDAEVGVDAPLDTADAGDALDAFDAFDAADAPDSPDVFDAVDAPDVPDVPDALPPLDLGVPEAPQPICSDPSVQFIYVVTQQNELFSYYPKVSLTTFTDIGAIDCPTLPPAPGQPTPTPFSMAVDHTGLAYVVFSDGELFEVSTKTAACSATAFPINPLPFTTFGMGFSSNADGTESLFVVSDGSPNQLGTIDTALLQLNPIAVIEPQISAAELTGTGAEQLFAFWSTSTITSAGAAIGEVDKTTAQLLSQTDLPTVTQGNAWAFAFFGGDFYMFTALEGEDSAVTRYRPSDGSTTVVATAPGSIVGAGVSTCAPLR